MKERAELVKKVLKEYREMARTTAQVSKGATLKPRDRTKLAQKQLALERANAEYMQLQKELETIISRMQTRVQARVQTKLQTRKRAEKTATH